MNKTDVTIHDITVC